MTGVIHVAVSPSIDYLPHCAVMLESLFFHNNREEFKVHVLWQETNPKEPIELLREFISSRGGECVVYGVGRDILEKLPSDSAWNKAVWLKLLIPKMVYADRVLYLDSDLILRSNISSVWGLELSENCLAAVQEVIPAGWLKGTHKNIYKLGVGVVSNYFNSGVMLMDLRAIRDAGFDDKLLEYARNPCAEKTMADQDTLNATLQGAWDRLPLKWNVGYHFFMYWRFDSPVDRDEFNDAVKNPRILHFCGPDKPWTASCRNPFRPEYIYHLASTPWADSGYDQYDLWGWFYYQAPLWFRRCIYSNLPRIKRKFVKFVKLF